LDREGSPTPFGPCEKQVPDVRAGNRQHEPGRTERHPEQLSDIANDDGGERTNRCPHMRLFDRRACHAAGKLVRELQKQTLQIGCRGFNGNPITQPRNGLVIERGRLRRRGIEPHRQPQCRVGCRETRAGGHDADDFVRHAIDVERPVQNGRTPAVLSRPQLFGDHDNRRCTRLIVELGEEAAPHRRHAQCGEKVGGHAGPGETLGLGAADRSQIRRRDLIAAEVGERSIVAPVEQESGIGLVDAEEARHDEGMGQGDEAVRAGIGQRAQQHRVDDAEDRRRAADAERERQDRGGGEAAVAQETASRVPERLHHVTACYVMRRMTRKARWVD
jgi:hypothetical protein